jgi:Uma2 family endonuclease
MAGVNENRSAMVMASKDSASMRWTRAELERLPNDGNRYEVLDGELFVTPQASFGHQRVAVLLTLAIDPYCALHGLGVVVAPGAVIFGESELQPDVQVVPGDPLLLSRKWEELARPLLVIGVLSEPTRSRDLGRKREAYLRTGIPEYWVIDAEVRRALVWTRGTGDPLIVTDTLAWHPRVELAPLELPLGQIFRGVGVRGA